MNIRSATVFAALIASPLCGWAQSSPQYSLTDLGTLGGSQSHGDGISSDGQVTGYAYTTGDTYTHAFLYSNGMMQDLGTLGGTYSGGSGVNSSGQVTGSAYTAEGTPRAFLYGNGTMQDLGTLGGAFSFGADVNSVGQVTGYAYTAAYAPHAFLYTNGAMEDLGTLGGALSTGASINSAGQVTGYSLTAANAGLHAFLYDNGTMQDLGTLGGTFSVGVGINSSGQVTGYAYTMGNAAFHAFLHSGGGTMQDLGTLGGTFSVGAAINSAGQVAGYSFLSGDVVSHAFLYTDGTMTDLNELIDPSSPLAPYVTLSEALGINDSGLIVANGVDSRTGSTHAYLLTLPQGQGGIADCAHIDAAASLFDAVFDRSASRPDVYQASFAVSHAEPAILCVDNGTGGKVPVTAGSVVLNGQIVVAPDDLKRNATGAPIEVRVDLLEQNDLTVRLTSKPGAEIRVRVFTALPASSGSP